ncbi:MAG: hypothetical protein KDI68_09325 [Gammaproteobacteria bacterium]|nr:hypothetical protein [Gammaproteobacteria bacterium]
MTKIKTLAAAVAIASISGFANADAPGAPSVYDSGPMSPALNTTNLSDQERAAFAALEAVMQATEGRIHSAGCPSVSLPLKVYSDALTSPVIGNASMGQSPNSIAFNVTGEAANYRGQKFNIAQNGNGYINGTAVNAYAGQMIFNSANNMMVGDMTALQVMSINWTIDDYTGKVIKDFYMGTGQGAGEVPDSHIVYDWGLQALLKKGYPVEKYWQRSKTQRSNGVQGKTVFVKDRLVGVVPCRITIALAGLNQVGVFQQSGTLTIAPAPVVPSTPVAEFTF